MRPRGAIAAPRSPLRSRWGTQDQVEYPSCSFCHGLVINRRFAKVAPLETTIGRESALPTIFDIQRKKAARWLLFSDK